MEVLDECEKQGFSKGSVQVAFEILHDMEFQSRGRKQCCGSCSANPQPYRGED